MYNDQPCHVDADCDKRSLHLVGSGQSPIVQWPWEGGHVGDFEAESDNEMGWDVVYCSPIANPASFQGASLTGSFSHVFDYRQVVSVVCGAA